MPTNSLRIAAAAAAFATWSILTPAARQAEPPQTRVVHREVCRLIADPTNKFTFVPPPAPLTAPDGSPMTSSLTGSPITVNFLGTWDPQALAAFRYAADIWQNTVASPVPIVVNASWVTAESNNLGSARAACVFRDFGAGIPSTWYHTALANKLAGTDLQPFAISGCNPHDIDANFNSARSDWYFGTDGIPQAGKYDFVSVVLHELGHGLGFSGSMQSIGGVAEWGVANDVGRFPMIYDRFTENAAGTDLINFPNPSAALHAELTSGNIFWNGPQGIAAAGTRPRLDAESPFTFGSNYSHLDELTYVPGNPNSLMTRSLGAAEVIHNPGPIALGILLDEGWSCSYSISPTSASFTPAGGTGQISVTTPAGCPWTAVSNSSFITITGGSSGSGSGIVTYSVAPSTNGARTGAITVAGHTFTIVQGALMAVERSALYFGAVNNGIAFTSQTPPQTVAVNFSGSSTAHWTASVITPGASWLTVTNGSGTGNGRFTVSVSNPGGTLPLIGSLTAAIQVASAAVANSPQIVIVTLTLSPPGASAFPIGSFDTPVASSTLMNSVAVTGWALDDVEVATVEIWRDPHPNDPPGAVFGGAPPRGGRVFIGPASFVAGARPDVEAAAPTVPLNYRAGWGYLMLTRGLVWDGGGQFRLYAVAVDREGHVTQIGEKLVSVSHVGATQPFGTIDTPPQGATINGVYPNTGWVLTPNPGHSIPAANVQVAIDGVFLGGPLSMSDRADITAGFAPMGFNTTGAGRGIFIDTTTYGNGVHTIGWLVTDTAAQADGVGSRFFTIANDSAPTASSTSAAAASPSSRFPRVYEREAALGARDAGGAVFVQTGMNPNARVRRLLPARNGIRAVRIAEMDRVEVRAGDAARSGIRPHYTAYLVSNGQLSPLPLGSTFDARRGVLYWQPGAGYVGTYQFVIVETTRGRAYRVSVTVGSAPVLAVRALG